MSELLSSSGPSRGQRRARVESPVANLDSYSLSARPEQPFALPLKFTSHSSLLLNNQLKSPRSFSQTPASAHTSLPCRLSVHPPLGGLGTLLGPTPVPQGEVLERGPSVMETPLKPPPTPPPALCPPTEHQKSSLCLIHHLRGFSELHFKVYLRRGVGSRGKAIPSGFSKMRPKSRP